MDTECTKEPFNQKCILCSNLTYTAPDQFASHLRSTHCTREGGSYVCLYGENRVCSSLPVEGISDVDYEQHIYKHHVFTVRIYQRQRWKKSSISSVCSMSTDIDKWNVYSASQNLSAVLNNPNKLKPKDFFTKSWGEGFVEISRIPDPHYLPVITKQHFENYLKKLLKRYRRRSKLKKTIIEDSSLENRKNFPSLKSKPIDKFVFDIPDIFMKTDFDLNDAETFNIVFPNIFDFIKANCDPGKAESSSNTWNRPKLIQEKLGYHLDVVEVQIAKQVSLKSDAFFHTMTSHDELMENLGHTLSKVYILRSKMKEIDDNLVHNSLRILGGVRTRNNHYLVLRKLKIMTTVYQTQPTVKHLLSTFDYIAALDLIYTTKDLLNNELAGIQCFRHLSLELNEMIKMIDALMIGELQRYAVADLNRPLLETETETLEKDKLLCIVLGLLRRQCFSFIDCYLRETSVTTQAAIKQAVIEIVAYSDSPVLRNTSEQDSNVFTLDEQLKLLTIDEWVLLLKNTAHSLRIILGRIKSVNDTIIQAISMCCAENAPKDDITICMEFFLDEENYNIVTSKLNHLISSACQYVSQRYSNLLSKKSLTEESERISSKEAQKSTSMNNNWPAEQATLTQLSDISGYVDSLCCVCQKLNSKDCSYATLKSAFKNEANKFMKKFHDVRSKKIDMISENETWKQTPVPIEFQSLLNEIVETGKFITYKASKRYESGNSPADLLCIGNEKFVVIGTVLLLINMIAEYCVLSENSILSAHTLLRFLSELLQQFNRKSCKLVLGGEAVSEKTGLKQITSSNLALLMRTLQLILELIPLIKKQFLNLLAADSLQSMNCLERVEDDIQSHIRDIKNTLLFIPTQIISTELKNWEAKPPIPSKTFQNLSRSLKKLHDAVSCILTQSDVYDLYRKININFKDMLRKRIISLNIINNGDPQHGVVITEMIFYLQDLKKIRALPETELNESFMNDLWRCD